MVLIWGLKKRENHLPLMRHLTDQLSAHLATSTRISQGFSGNANDFVFLVF
jgi:hypothetical protein